MPPPKTVISAVTDGAPAYDVEAVAPRAVEAVLSSPEAKGNAALGGLLRFLVTPEPVVEKLPALFMPAGTPEVDAGSLLEIAVAGKLLYAQVRWLDDLADSVGRPLPPPGEIHRLSEFLSLESGKRFAAGFAAAEEVIGFSSSLTVLNARYATSLAIDGARGRSSPERLSLGDYVEHAKARAAPLRAPLDALLALVGSPLGYRRAAYSCFETAAAAVQLHDDALDVEEDYEERRLSWVVARTLRHLGHPDPLPDVDDFYEAALLGGSIDENLEAAEGLYEGAIAGAQGRFPGCVAWLEKELRDTRGLRHDMGWIVAHGYDDRPGHEP